MKRSWVLPISAFPFIGEAQMATGLTLNLDPAWVLDSGAGPVCNPNRRAAGYEMVVPASAAPTGTRLFPAGTLRLESP